MGDDTTYWIVTMISRIGTISVGIELISNPNKGNRCMITFINIMLYYVLNLILLTIATK